ncbi:MAG: nucleotidyltransferase family protein [Candidatus Altiarchaeota archaeon]|nr:nucleotidyltransferase family protein [Candidatus Altiarchaeota archaeon]
MVKRRISLTLNEGILTKADRLVGHLAENRSVVFEKLLERAFLSMTPKTAVILTGSGREGVLLEDFKGKLVIERHLENLGLAGVNRIIFVGKELSKIKAYVKNRKERFLFVDDDEAGTAGALKAAQHLLREKFFLVYGDTISSIDYTDLYQFHTKQEVMATVALTTWKEPQKFGIPEIKGTKITGFKEKPVKTESYLVSSGSFVIEPEVIELISQGKPSLEKNILPKLASINQLGGYIFSGNWIDLGQVSS